MEQSPKYYIVEASALPEIFQKVAEAKRMLETGETDKVNVAAQAVGISRSPATTISLGRLSGIRSRRSGLTIWKISKFPTLRTGLRTVSI